MTTGGMRKAGTVGAGRRAGRATLACLLLMFATVSSPADAARARSLFDRLSGSWSGDGVAGLSAGAFESVRCLVTYRPADSRTVHVDLRCAGGGYHVEVGADLARDGERLAGTLTERSLGMSGSLAGRVGADRIEAVVTGMSLSARLSLVARGRVQAVTLRGLGSLSSASATMRLRPL